MVNPFIINGYEGDKYFCDREVETQEIIHQLVNGNNIALIATRRIGKSGLIKHCFEQPEIKDVFYTFYVDIYATRSLQEFVFRLSREIVTRLKPFGIRALQTFWDCVRSLQAGLSFSPSGDVSFNLQIGDITHSENSLEEIFHYLQTADRPCIVAIDEFQKIADYDDKNIEALLRTYIQQMTAVRFVFSGSQRHLMSQIFQSPARPFYQSVSMMNLGSIDIDRYRDFAKAHFVENGKYLEDGVVEEVYRLSNNITWYIQRLMNTLFSNTPFEGRCDLEMVHPALEYIIDSYSFGYNELMYRIPEKQRNVLIALAKEGKTESVTSGCFIRKYHLNSASTVQSAIRGLLDKDYVTQENGKYYVYDLFLMYWLRKEY